MPNAFVAVRQGQSRPGFRRQATVPRSLGQIDARQLCRALQETKKARGPVIPVPEPAGEFHVQVQPPLSLQVLASHLQKKLGCANLKLQPDL